MESFGATLSWLGRVSAQASLLVLLILLLQWVLRSRLTASWRYALWWVVVLRLILPLAPESTLSIFNYAKFQKIGSAENGLIPKYPGRLNPFASSSDLGGFSSSGPPKRPDIAVVQPGAPGVAHLAVATSAPDDSVAGGPTVRPAYGWMFGLWLGGVIFLGSRLAWGNYLFSRRLKHRPSIAEPAVLALLEECQRVIGTRTRLTLIESREVESPALFGCFHLRLLLPQGMARNFSLIELRHVFLHELAHVKRHDVFANWFVSVLQTLHWFNPVLWFAFARMRADRELACDALVLSKVSEGENQSYGETLIKLLDTFGPPKRLAALVGIMEAKTGIKKRISMIATFRKPSKLSALAALVLLGLGLVTLTDAESEKRESAKRDANPGKAQLAADPVSEFAEPSEAEPGSIDLNESDKAKIAERGDQKISPADLAQAERPETGQLAEPETRLNEAPKGAPSKDWNTPIVRDQLPKARPSPITNLIHTSKGAQIIRSKLDRIVIQETPAFEGVPLIDVVKYLREESVKRDPDEKGVNFIINTHVDSMGPFSGGAIDPNTGLPVANPPDEQVDLNRATVRVPPLENVRLIDLIDAISKSCDQPIKYSVEEYAVVFSRKTADAAQLFTRTFKVDPNTFLQGLHSLVEVPAPNESLFKYNAALSIAGPLANSSTNAALDIQQRIRRFFEAAGVSFSPSSRNQLFFSDRSGMLMVRATLPELDIIEQAIEVLNTAPAQVMIEAKLVEISTEDHNALGFDWLLGNTTTNRTLAPPSTTGPVATLTGIMTDPQFRVVNRAMEQGAGSEIVAAPRFTTLSGRQTRITLNNGAIVFDCIPSVAADGYSIQMTMNCNLDEEQNETGAANSNRKENSTKHQLSTSAIVWDGQTMVLGGFPTVEKDTSGRKSRSKKMLLVFVTPTIIDPAGNPVHTADNRPFDPDHVPPQKSVQE